MDIQLKLKRVIKTDTYTIGNLSIDGEFFCNTLEDTCRIVNNNCSMKIYGKTAIPEGTYDIEMIWWEKHNNFYPHLLNVPCFEGILIHSGITANDTEGCVLVGEQKQEPGTIGNGLIYMNLLREKFKDQINKIENCPSIKITII
jgi:hypothetical protein